MKWAGHFRDKLCFEMSSNLIFGISGLTVLVNYQQTYDESALSLYQVKKNCRFWTRIRSHSARTEQTSEHFYYVVKIATRLNQPHHVTTCCPSLHLTWNLFKANVRINNYEAESMLTFVLGPWLLHFHISPKLKWAVCVFRIRLMWCQSIKTSFSLWSSTCCIHSIRNPAANF